MALVMAKHPTKRFSGELREPILKKLIFPFGVVPGDSVKQREAESLRRELDLKFKKLLLLLKHYKLENAGEDRWIGLAYHLACDFVPGMQVKDRPNSKRLGRPRKVGRYSVWLQLRDEVDKISKERGCGIADAIVQLQKRRPKDWGSYKKTTLETRYHEAANLRREDLQKYTQSLTTKLRKSLMLSK